MTTELDFYEHMEDMFDDSILKALFSGGDTSVDLDDYISNIYNPKPSISEKEKIHIIFDYFRNNKKIIGGNKSITINDIKYYIKTQIRSIKPKFFQ